MTECRNTIGGKLAVANNDLEDFNRLKTIAMDENSQFWIGAHYRTDTEVKWFNSSTILNASW
jgi:hypothetical protein